ncbi:MAG: DUF1329 domain-containing protein [Pseudomonadota bacterium]
MNQILKASVLMLMAASAQAGVSAAEADRLGKDLTPIGAERGASADGLIPAWQGRDFYTAKQTQVTRPELEALRKGNPANAFALLSGKLADDKPRLTITRANMAQYAAQLTEGHKAMFRLYPSYKMNIYPTVRTGFFPDQIYAATKKNATSAQLQGTDDLTGAAIGFPFPIPKTGAEVIWNHRLKYRGNAVRLVNNSAIVAQNGGVQQSRFIADVKFIYANYKTPAPADNKLALYFSAKNLAPARVAGQSTLVHEPLMGSRSAWLFDPGIGRVRRAPDVGFDNPTLGADGEQFNDQVDTFNGSLERYDWKLLGKKPMLIAYNSGRIQSPALKVKDLLTKGHANQDHARYELHRVWVVEATLKGGQRHQFKKRRFYVDEDSWSIAAVDCYDNRDQLWRFQEAHLTTVPFLPTVTPSPEFIYDLLTGRYYATGLINESEYSDWTMEFKDSHFLPQNLSK